MKKLLALSLLLLVMALPCAVLAEGDTVTIDITFDGTYVPFEEDDFQLYLPNEWSIFEISDELMAQGIFFVAGAEDGSQRMMLNAIEAEGVSVEALAQGLAAALENVEIISLNGVNFITYTLSTENAAGMVALNTNGYAYNFVFYPADDSEFMNLASQIMASFTALE